MSESVSVRERGRESQSESEMGRCRVEVEEGGIRKEWQARRMNRTRIELESN